MTIEEEVGDATTGRRNNTSGVQETEHAIAVATAQHEVAAQWEHESDHAEEEKPYHFAPEGSVSTEEGTWPDPVTLVAQQLSKHLRSGIVGCSVQQHADRLHQRQRQQAIGDRHHSLADVGSDDTFPSVLTLRDIISAERVARQRVPTTVQWQSMYCGNPPQSTPQSSPSTHEPLSLLHRFE